VVVASPVFQSPTDLAFLLYRVGSTVQTRFKDVLAGWKLRPLELVVLTHLDSTADGTSQQQLCNISKVDSGNIAGFIDNLEAI
jgi:hypothetical protein